MSSPTRCVDQGDSQVCLWIDTAGDGTSCLQASYNGEDCQECTYVDDVGMCATTSAGYSLNCRSVVNLVDMKICGNILSATVPGSAGGGDGVKMGALVFFILLFSLSMGMRLYAEVRRCREGLDQEETQQLKQTKNEKEKHRDVELATATAVDQDENNRKGTKKNDKPEEALNFDNKRNSKKELQHGNSRKKSTSEKKKESSASKTRSSSGKDLVSGDGSRKPSGSGKHRKKRSSSHSKDSEKNGDSKTLDNKTVQAPVASFDFDEVSWDQPTFEPAFVSTGDVNSENKEDAGSADPDEILPGKKFEAYDETKGDPKASALRKHHRKRDWEAIRSFFHKIRRRIIERQHYIDFLVQLVAADWPEPIEEDTIFCEYLDEWKEAEPENLQCNVIRLEVWIAWAWHGRTKAFAHEISPERVELFYDRMDSGAAELERVLQVTKKRDALVYAAAIKIATGRNDDQAVVRQYMKEVQSSNDPANFIFHTRALEYFCEKWHGSHEEMMDYAKWITDQLPDGHPLWILIPVAHYECATLMDSAGERMSYWHKQHDSIVEAYEKALGGQWEMTVNPEVSPACQKLDHVIRNWFVYGLGKCRATELAQRQARVIGKRPLAELPWDEKYTYIKHVKNLGFVFDSAAVV